MRSQQWKTLANSNNLYSNNNSILNNNLFTKQKTFANSNYFKNVRMPSRKGVKENKGASVRIYGAYCIQADTRISTYRWKKNIQLNFYLNLLFRKLIFPSIYQQSNFTEKCKIRISFWHYNELKLIILDGILLTFLWVNFLKM